MKEQLSRERDMRSKAVRLFVSDPPASDNSGMDGPDPEGKGVNELDDSEVSVQSVSELVGALLVGVTDVGAERVGLDRA